MAALIINGKSVAFDAEAFPSSVAALLVQRGLEGKAILAEVNGTMVSREAFATTALADGDRVELVQFVGGG